MKSPTPAREWVHIAEYAHTARLGRNWRAAAIVLIVVVALGVLVAGVGVVRTVFAPSDDVLAVTVPRDCRVSDGPNGSTVSVAIDVSALFDGRLSSASSLSRDEVTVLSAVVVPELAPLAELSDSEIDQLVQNAAEGSQRVGAPDAESAVLLLVGDLPRSTEAASWDGVTVTWVLGEPVIEQTVPLGVEFADGKCTIANGGLRR